MKIYFNSDFTITKREYEEYYLGSEYHNKIEVYFPMTTYGNYTYIYPVFNVKRPDDRKFGEFALTEYNVENDYIIWRADLPAKALEVQGALEITIIFKYSTDNKYAKVSTGKVLLNVKEAVIGEENDVIFTGSGDNLQGEIDAIRNEFGVRFNNVETHFINDLAELDNYKTPGIYRFNLDNLEVFHLFVYGYENEFTQIRSSSSGYYSREYDNGVWTEWSRRNYAFTDNLKTVNGESIVGNGDIVIKGGSGNAIDLSNYYDIPTTNALLAAKEDKANLKALAYKDSLSKSDVGLGNVRNVESYSKTETDEKISDVVEIAEGKTNSYVLKWLNNPSFKSNEDVIRINLKDNPILDSSGAAVPNTALKIGDIFYIIETNVPDRWLGGIDGDVYTFAKMETSKVNLTDYLKNNDIKKDTYFSSTYKGYNLYGQGNNDSYSGFSLSEHSINLSNNNNGNSSIYLGGGNISIYCDNDVTINTKSFNKLYEDVQLLKGSYDLIDSPSGVGYEIAVPSNTEKYAMVSKIGGMSYKSTNLFNGVYEFGNLNTSTGAFEAGDFGCCSDYIKVDSNTTYSYRDKRNVSANFETIFYVVEYDANKGFIQHELKQLPVTNGIYFVSFTTQATTKYIRFMAIANYETEYMPTEATLVKGTYTVSTLNYIEYFNGIRHTKVTDIKLNNNIVIDLSSLQDMEGYGVGINENCYNYLDFDKDVLVKRVVSYTFNGTETIASAGTNTNGKYRFFISFLEKIVKKPESDNIAGNILMKELDTITNSQATNNVEGVCIAASGKVVFYKNDITDGTAMLNYLKGKTIFYELAEPIENALPQIDTFIDVSSGGRFTFENENQQAVPYEIKYIRVV